MVMVSIASPHETYATLLILKCEKNVRNEGRRRGRKIINNI